MSKTPILDKIENQDSSVNLEQIKHKVGKYEAEGRYVDRKEMVGAIRNRIASYIMGWDEYSHLDSGTKNELEQEIHYVSEEIADEISAN